MMTAPSGCDSETTTAAQSTATVASHSCDARPREKDFPGSIVRGRWLAKRPADSFHDLLSAALQPKALQTFRGHDIFSRSEGTAMIDAKPVGRGALGVCAFLVISLLAATSKSASDPRHLWIYDAGG